MSDRVFYDKQPTPIQYMPLPDGSADVWLRKNITAAEDSDEWGWCADETYIHTGMSLDEVAANFDQLFNANVQRLTVDQRLAVLEDELAAAKILLGVE